MQVVSVYLQPLRRNLLLKCVAAQNREKFTSTLYFGGSRSFKSLMLTPLRSSSPVLVMISSMYVSISGYLQPFSR